MSDERTLRLAHRPVTPAILGKYMQFVQLELDGKAPAEALIQSGLTADEVARTASAVNAFCRPRLLKRRLARASAKTPEKQMKLLEELAKPIDDTDFVALYGEETHRVLLSHEEPMIELRAKAVGEG
jgi:hypothetical protein